ncbi:hypothetical protein GCM10007103_26380 [Salinimicrobium marinum]|uniref:Uncharacterized protein n=1 Tax=Salinimicrobium marinum TaxID=680283 RepID=A0A918SI11_9FLAO|nr:glycosyltransferase [Salinimicrobium marinum]GHA43892.1 hypothetical protein GCM10007103_26380 [Salinimicrobium marinum]
MKILHVSTIIEWRGGDNQMLTTYNILKKYQDLQQIIFCAKDSVLEQKCREQKISYYSASRKSKYSLKFLRELINTLKKEKIDILHVHDSKAFTLSLLAIRLFPNLKFIYSRKRNNKVTKNFFKVKKYNSSRIDKIICVSEAVKDVLKPVLKDHHKVRVIYDGIDVDYLSASSNSGILHRDYNIPEGTKLIGNIAGLTKQKDLFTFLESARLIEESFSGKIKFILVGQGPLEKELKQHANKLGLANDIIFTGFRNDVAQILPEFDLFMISSETEGLPLSVLEAFACKVPVVATAAGGTGEAVIHEHTGMISPVKDAASLAENVKKVLENNQLKDFMVANAFDLVHEKFSLEVMQKNYYELYKSI